MESIFAKLIVTPDGRVEAYYSFIDETGLPQHAGRYVVLDPALVKGITDAAKAAIDADLAALAAAAPTPAKLVEAMTKMGAAQQAEVDAAQRAADMQAAADVAAAKAVATKQAMDQQIAEAKTAFEAQLADYEAKLANLAERKAAVLADAQEKLAALSPSPAAAETKPGGLAP